MDDEITSIIITLIIIMKQQNEKYSCNRHIYPFFPFALLYPFFHLKLCIFSLMDFCLVVQLGLWFSTVFENSKECLIS